MPLYHGDGFLILSVQRFSSEPSLGIENKVLFATGSFDTRCKGQGGVWNACPSWDQGPVGGTGWELLVTRSMLMLDGSRILGAGDTAHAGG